MIKDQKTIFYLLLGISSFFVIALIFFNIKFIFDKRDMDNTTIKYKKTAQIYAEQTSSMNELKEEYDEKKANLLARIGAKGTTKYLDTVQKIASIFTKNEILVLSVNPKNFELDIAKNFEILNDDDFDNINTNFWADTTDWTYDWTAPDSIVCSECNMKVTVYDTVGLFATDINTFSIEDDIIPEAINIGFEDSIGVTITSISEYLPLTVTWDATDNIGVVSVEILYSADNAIYSSVYTETYDTPLITGSYSGIFSIPEHICFAF